MLTVLFRPVHTQKLSQQSMRGACSMKAETVMAAQVGLGPGTSQQASCLVCHMYVTRL